MSRPVLLLVLSLAMATPLAAQTATPIDYAPVVLEGVEALTIRPWTEAGNPPVRHVGPTPEEFYAAFSLGSAREIAGGDADGVALLAIQALARRLGALEAENASLRTTAAGLQNELAALRAQFERFEGERR